MSYKINTADGTLLVDLVDGRIDTDTTDLVLVGRNFTGYGEYFNENFIKLLENFSNSAPPANPIRGQLWYDTSENRLKIFDGTNFRSTDATIVSATQPTMLSGDIWIDTNNKQIYFSDGSELILAGPIYTDVQGESGFSITTITDNTGQPRVVARFLIGGSVIAIVSGESFTAATSITNFGTSIQAGWNMSSEYTDFKFNGPAASTTQLIDSLGNLYTPNSFLKIASNNTTTGWLHVKNDTGLIVGDDSDFTIRVEGNAVVQRSQISGSDLKIQVRQGASNVDAIKIDNLNSRIGLWQSTPLYSLDLSGSMRITGDLIVGGSASYFDVTNIRVEDKSIELGITSGGTTFSELELDGAGIIVKSGVSDKSLTWSNANNNWNATSHFNIPTGYQYKINNTLVLSATALGSSVTSASGLTSLGVLNNLDVDYINLNGATITTTGYPLYIVSDGTVVFSDPLLADVKLSGIATPDVSDPGNYVANKTYVDEKFQDQNVYLTFDITGVTNTQLALYIEDLVPGITKNVGVYAYVHCTAYSGTITYNGSDGINKTFVAVDKNGVENQSVLQDVGFSNTVETVSLSVSRSLKVFQLDGSYQWTYLSTSVYP
jgi:hypothetical protein